MSQHKKEAEPQRTQGFDFLFTLLKKRIGQVTTLVGLTSALVFLVVTKFTAIQQALHISSNQTQDTCLVLSPPDIPQATLPVSMLGKTTLELKLKNNCHVPRFVYFVLTRDLSTTTANPLIKVDPPYLSAETHCETADVLNPECWKSTRVEPGERNWIIAPSLTQVGNPTKDRPLEISLSWWLYDYDNSKIENHYLYNGDTKLTVLPDEH